jgi:DNA-binding FrmR family transcriptional regulator
MTPVLIAAASAGAAVVVAAGVRWLLHWLGRAIGNSMREAITETVQPQLSAVDAKLSAAFDVMLTENREDHLQVAERLDAVDARLDAAESRLASVESAMKEMSATAPTTVEAHVVLENSKE